MASDDTSAVNETGSAKQPQPAETGQNPGGAIRNFLVGAGLSAIAILTLLSISLWTTHSGLNQIGAVEIAVLLAIPLGCGGLAVFFKQQFLDALSAVLNALPL
jgi:hypothetical protein